MIPLTDVIQLTLTLKMTKVDPCNFKNNAQETYSFVSDL